MSELTAFVTARCDEDEAVWKAIAKAGADVCDPDVHLHLTGAIRKMVAEWERALADQNRMLASPAGDQSVTYEWVNGKLLALDNALRMLAGAWSDHPDYPAAVTAGG